MMKNKNYLHTWQLDNSFAFFQSLKAKSVLLGWMLLTFFISSNLLAQTTLDPGDIAIIGVNANNGACGFPTEDIISFVAFKDITSGTQLDITDNGWERLIADRFGDTEGTFRFTRSAGTITAGTTFNLIFRASYAETVSANPNWSVTDLNGSNTNVNMNSTNGDQIYVMQNGTWDNMGSTGDHNATYSGNVLYGFNTIPVWTPFANSSSESGLHPDVDPCFHMEPTGGTTNFISYSGPTTATTQLEWISRFGDPNNWTSYLDCGSYVLPPSSIAINPSGMSINCSVCSGCSPVNSDLTFNLPTTGGPFNVVYTDGTSNFSLSGIDNGYVESVVVTVTTTFDLVSVTDINGCPVYSNFQGGATITVGANGGNASLSGGGILCTGNCSEITFTINGGQAPYDVEFLLSIGPINIPFTIPVPNNNFTINICSDDVPVPSYNSGTNTLTIPDFIVAMGSVTLLSLTDATNCQGTVNPNPLSIDIFQTPTANAAGPLNACDEGGAQANFNLTSLNNTINGNSGNPVNWFTDQQLNNPIGNPANFMSVSTTVYATVSTTQCTSEPVAIQLIVDPVPTANPAADEACADINGQATFDLTSLNTIVNGNNGNPVNWYADINGNNPIPNPTNYTTTGGVVYATVSNGNCESATVVVTLTVNSSPSANSASDELCDEGGGIATFNLTMLNNIVNGNSGNPVNWYSDPGATVLINNPSNYVTSGGSVYAVVSNGNCESNIVEITLTVLPTPIAIPTTATECDNGNGFAIFDLTALNEIVNGNSGNTVNWFLDAGTLPIGNPSNFSSPGGIVYANVENGNCSSPFVEILLIVTQSPVANTASASACDEGNGTATFDLTALDNTVNNGTNNLVSWYFDNNGTNPIPDPDNYVSGSGLVYAQVGNGNCTSPVVEITLSVTPAPTANTAADTLCEETPGLATFNLTNLNNIVNGNSGNPVNWFTDANANNPVPDPGSFESPTGSVFAVVDNGICASQIVEILLTVDSIPQANPTSADECDDGSGTATFDLMALENTVNGGSTNTVSWFEDANATLPIASPYTTGTTTIYATVDDGNCISAVVEIILNVGDAPEAFPATAEECDDGSGTAAFNLTALESTVNGGTSNPVNWFEDDAATIPISSPYITASTIVYATVGDGNCISEIVEITLNVVDSPQANSASDEECDDGSGTATFDLSALESTVNGGTTNQVNWFEDDAATIPISSPYTTASTTVYATVGDGNCISEIVEITLNVVDSPDAAPASAQKCDEGNGTATFDLTALENIVNTGSGNQVNWYQNAGATIPISSPYITASTVVYANVGTGNCISITVGIQLTVLPSPSAAPASAELCDDGNGTATFDLTALESTVNGGSGNPVNWFEDNAGTIPITSPYTTASTTVYATVGGGNCISNIVEITLDVLDSPEANSSSANECDDGTGTAIFNLTALEPTINGGTNDPVNWFEDVNGTIPITSPYTSISTTIYAIVGSGICISEPVGIQLIVGEGPDSAPAFTSACDEGNGTATFNLTALENTVNTGTADPVNWYQNAAATIPISSPYITSSTTVFAIVGTGTCLSQVVGVQLTVLPAPVANPASASECDDGTGTATFNLTSLETTVNNNTNNTVNWFENAAATIPITSPYTSATTTVFAYVDGAVCNSPIVPISLSVLNIPQANSTSTEECDTGNGTASFDLSLLENTVNGGSGNQVNWFEDLNATIPLSSPYSTSSTTIFATVENGNCVSQIVEIDLNVLNIPIANPASAAVCDDGTGTATFDLNLLESTINGGSGNTVIWFEDMNGTIPVASPYTTGSATIYAAVDNGNCISGLVEISLDVIDSPEANPAFANTCDDGTGMATFDLSLLESTVNGGTGNLVSWFEDANASIPIVSPYNSTSTTIYANVADGNCVSETVAIDLNILTNPTFDYSDMLCEDENVTINGNIYDINNPIGTEIIQGGASNGCDSIVFITLDFFEPVTGNISGETTICDGQSVELTFNLSGANSFDLVYSDGVNPAIPLTSISDGHTITVFPTSTTTYSLISISGNGIPCAPTFPTSSVTITVTAITADFNILTDYQGFSVSCNTANDGAAQAIPLSGTPPFSYQWSNGTTAPTANALSAGNYSVTVTDATGCTVEGDLTLSEPTAIQATVQTVPPDCINFLNGSIIIDDVTGGAGNYEYSLDGEIFTPISGFPVVIPFLPSGNYELMIQDFNDCAISQNLFIQEAVQPFVNLGNDVEIILGDSIRLDAETNFEVAEIFWDPIESLSCTDCLDPFAMPFETTTYSIVVVDSTGCSATDEVTITVKKSRNVYIPSAFSPNGDGTNDKFFVFAGSNVVLIKQFTIFSRWGEVIHSVNNIQPDDRSASWNGEFKGQRLNPGVFVYLFEIEFIDGKTFIYKGDVTLMK